MSNMKKCLICSKKFTDKQKLVSHIEKTHSSQIPPDWTPAQYENFLRTGRTHGTCVVCKGDTDWNESTWKWNRLCKNPECRKALAENAKSNMVAKYGKEHLLNDPDMQRKMIYSKKNSGHYIFESDDGSKQEIMYDSSYGKDFLEMLEHFLGYSANDVMGPSPNTYVYKYDGEDHFYIPDFYIPSLNLEVEIKDGGDNPNMMPKIQQVDKVKEVAKDKVMNSLKGKVNYIKVVNKQYKDFFTLCSELKNSDIELQPTNGITKRGINTLTESFTYEDTVTEMLSLKDTLDKANALYMPVLNFHKLIAIYRREIPKLKPEDIPAFEEELLIVRNRLQEIMNDPKSEDDERMYYEAKKSLDYLDRVIVAELNRHIEHISKGDVSIDPFIMESENVNLNDKYILLTEASDITAMNKDLVPYHPVFVLLTYTDSKVAQIIHDYTHDPYSHASVSFDTILGNMYSFNFNGFVNENIHADLFDKNKDVVKYSLYMYMAPDVEYSNMNVFLDGIKQKSLQMKYNIRGLFDFVFGREGQEYKDHYFCSEFVAALLQSGNSALLNKKASSYKPTDLARSKRLIFVKKGIMKNYNEKEIDNVVKRILEKEGYQNVSLK